MPQQTSVQGYIYFPEGCAISGAFNGGAYTDLGVMKGGCKASLGWKENRVHFGGGGYSKVQMKDMIISGTFVMYNLDKSNIGNLSAGALTLTTTPGSGDSSIPNQIISAGWATNTKYNLIFYNSAAGMVSQKFSAKPVLTSVTLYDASSPEVLTEWSAADAGNYELIIDADSPSGWSIIFNTTGLSLGSPTTRIITIVFGTNTPVATNSLYMGSSSVILNPYKIKFVHTDSAGLTRGGEIFSVTPKSPFDFSIKGVDENDLEEMSVSFEGYCDSTLTDGQALMRIWADIGSA